MKRGRGILSCLLLASLLLLAGCSGAPEKQTETTGETGSWRVVVATDLHYLAPSLTDHGEIFRRVMEAGDGKVTEFCDEIADAFLEEVRVGKPDALILTGDVSFNGEKASHLALAEKLALLEEAGVSVLVLEWTHGNSGLFEGVDIPILLSSTPAETRAYRLARGRDANADTAFITMVLELEQAKLEARAGAAKLIVSKSCELLSHDEYVRRMNAGR